MDLSNLEPVIKLAIRNPESQKSAQFGPGIAALCRGVREVGSLNAAAKNMGMAYSKAWRIITETEESLGFQMLVRDGAHGSTLTPEAERILEAYDKLSASLRDHASSEFSALV